MSGKSNRWNMEISDEQRQRACQQHQQHGCLSNDTSMTAGIGRTLRLLPIAGTLIILACAMSLASCDDDDDDADRVSVEEFPEEWAESVCGSLRRCVGESFMELSGMASQDECEDMQEDTLENNDFTILRKVINDGQASFNEEEAARCLAAVRSASCGDLERKMEECTKAIKGTVEPGQACTSHYQCKAQEANYCKITNQCPGVCAARITEGGSCSHQSSRCTMELVCSTDGICTKPAAPGGECGGSSGKECTGTMVCSGEDSEAEASGTCTEITGIFTGVEHALCNPMGMVLCRGGLYCAMQIPEEGNMLPEFRCVTEATAEGDCSLSLPDQCPKGFFCRLEGQYPDMSGTCTRLPTAGQACESACAHPSRCVDEVCVDPRDNGEGCSQDDECWSDHCADTGKCAAEGLCQ